MDLSTSHPLSPTTTNPPSLYPETWLPMGMSQDFLQVPVSREDRSYRTVYSLFHKTVSETKFRIIKIQRVQNPFLWEKYKRWAKDYKHWFNTSLVLEIQSVYITSYSWFIVIKTSIYDSGFEKKKHFCGGQNFQWHSLCLHDFHCSFGTMLKCSGGCFVEFNLRYSWNFHQIKSDQSEEI